MTRICTAVLLVVVSAWALVAAQTPQCFWSQPNVASTTQAQGFTYKIYVTPAGSGVQNTPIVLTSVTCTGAAPTVNCVAPLPATASIATITGAKTSLTSQDTVGGTPESLQSAPFTPGSAVPGAFKIQ